MSYKHSKQGETKNYLLSGILVGEQFGKEKVLLRISG